MTTWNKQIENRNYLSPIGFKFLLAKFPKVAYFCQSANIPAMTLKMQQQPSPLRSLPLEGFMEYDPLTINFLIDEDLENYMIMHNWSRALGTPDFTSERTRFLEKMDSEFGNASKLNDQVSPLYADGTLTVLNSNFNMNFNVVFKGLVPTGLSALEFSATVDGTEYAMASVSFNYQSYEVQETVTNTRDTRLT